MKNLQKGFAIPIIIAIIALLTIGGGVYIYTNTKVEAPVGLPEVIGNMPTTTVDSIVKVPDPVKVTPVEPVACTMDAFQCPDGSYVGRSGPKCEFVCPAVNKTNLAKDFLVNMQKDLGTNFEIKEVSKNVNFFEGRKTLSGFSITSTNLKTPEYSYFSSKGMERDMYNTGDATIKGSNAMKGDSLVCIIYSGVINYSETIPQEQWINQTEIFCAEHDNPPLGQSIIELVCNSKKCQTSGVSSSRADFYYQDDILGNSTIMTVKILIDIETRLRYKISDSETSIVKWVDFYPLISKPAIGNFNGAIHGDWIDANTFKANWIFWPSYPRG